MRFRYSASTMAIPPNTDHLTNYHKKCTT